MFGGLEIKGDDDKSNDAGALPTSAFGFLNAAAESSSSGGAINTVAAPGSGFSFLNAAATAVGPAGAELANSGFSFLKESSTASAPAPELAPVETTTSGMGAMSSGFSFMLPSPDFASAGTDEPSPAAAAAAANATSAFGFLSAVPSTISVDATPASLSAAAGHSRVDSVVSTASSNFSAPSPMIASTTPPNVLELPPSNQFPTPTMGSTGMPTGAGITFGTSTTSANKPRKKKTRANRVGFGTTASAAVPPLAPAPVPAVQAAASSSASTGTPSSSPNRDTRDAALEAQRRAEEFMNKKSVAEANIATASTISTTTVAAKQQGHSTYDETQYALRPSSSTDEEVVRAQRAAEEAQKMALPKDANRGGFMGTFFKGFGSNSSLPKTTPNNSGHDRQPSPATTVDRLTQQQQEMKRAAAERQMHMHHRRYSASEDADDVVVISTGVSGYQQPEPLPIGVLAPGGSAGPTKGPSIPSNGEPNQPSSSGIKIVVKEIAPTPKKKKTPTQAFEEYQALFAQSVHRAIQQVDVVRSQQRMLSEERFVSIAKERLAIQQIQQTEAQLQIAVENEDYELADQLGQVIEGHKREKAEVASVLDSIAKGLLHLESQKALVVQGVATCFDNLAVHIKELQEQESVRGVQSDSETLKQFATISKQLSAEQERLAQDQKHLERDEALVGEERNELESAISEQSGEYERQRDEVKAKLSTIEEEIAELRRQLEAKSVIAAGLRTEMHGLEDNISRVRVKFSRQLTRVEKKEMTIQENRLEWETESAMFKRQKEAHELQVKSHSEALLAQDALMKTMDDELKLCKEFAGMVSTKLGFMQTDGKLKESEDAEAESNLAQLQADVVKCEAACSEAKVILKAAAATVANLEAEHAMLITRVPQLEAEKKAHAAKRDFKAASKASKEIKDATARLKECEEELVGEAAEKKKVAEEELQKLMEELEKTRKVAEEEEKLSGIARMHDLAKQIQQLVTTKNEMCGETCSNQNTVRGVGAFVLEGQIKALKDEGQHLGDKYGGWNDLVKDILGEEVRFGEEPKSEHNEEESSPAPPPVEDGLTSEMRIAKVRDLIKRLQDAEKALEAAAEREDFDEAARLQDVFENLQMELENSNLTDEESELAFAEDGQPCAATPTVSPEAPSKVEHENHDESTDDTMVDESTATEEVLPPTETVDPEGTSGDGTLLENGGAKDEAEQVDDEKETKESEPEDDILPSITDDVLDAEGESAR